MNGLELIELERQRQLEKYDSNHDDFHTRGGLAVIAATLAVDGTDATVEDLCGRGSTDDPWRLIEKHGHKAVGGDRLRALAIAGALIAAELDRQLRIRERES